MIVVTGATGRLGRAVVERLLRRVPADSIGVSVRDPAKAAGPRRAGRPGAARRLRRRGKPRPRLRRGRAASCSSRRPPPARRRCGSTARRSTRRGRPGPAGRLHEPHGRQPAVTVRAHAGPRGDGGDARAGVGPRLHRTPQRLLHVVGPHAPRARPGHRRGRRPGGRPGLLDRPRRPGRRGGDRASPRTASTARPRRSPAPRPSTSPASPRSPPRSADGRSGGSWDRRAVPGAPRRQRCAGARGGLARGPVRGEPPGRVRGGRPDPRAPDRPPAPDRPRRARGPTGTPAPMRAGGTCRRDRRPSR